MTKIPLTKENVNEYLNLSQSLTRESSQEEFDKCTQMRKALLANKPDLAAMTDQELFDWCGTQDAKLLDAVEREYMEMQIRVKYTVTRKYSFAHV